MDHFRSISEPLLRIGQEVVFVIGNVDYEGSMIFSNVVFESIHTTLRGWYGKGMIYPASVEVRLDDADDEPMAMIPSVSGMILTFMGVSTAISTWPRPASFQ